jgi:hypothetical protein
MARGTPQGPRRLRGAQYALWRLRPTLPPPPPGWRGSPAEWWCYWALEQEGLHEPEDFTYESARDGGRLFYGGLLLDFVLPHHRLALNVQGDDLTYSDGIKRRRDRALAFQVAQYGLALIWLDAADLARSPRYYVQEALRGIDHSRLGSP